jgi:hypothetical protein
MRINRRMGVRNAWPRKAFETGFLIEASTISDCVQPHIGPIACLFALQSTNQPSRRRRI